MFNPLNSINRSACILFAGTILTACGGGGGGSNDPQPGPAVKNVALASNGASVSSTFSGNETFVNDGDTGTANFWQAGAVGDSVTVDFDKTYVINRIEIFSKNLTSISDFELRYSIDGVNFFIIDTIGDCLNFSLGASGYSCDLEVPGDTVAGRLTILDKADQIEIYEVEILGE